MGNEKITVETTVEKTIDIVWEKWTTPQHIMAWNNASEDWYTPSAENDLRPGGKFNYKMSARDGSYSFDFSGSYEEVVYGQRISYTIDDGRKVIVDFAAAGGRVKVTETFEAEHTFSLEQQRDGWQAILDNFKRYTEKG